MTQEGQSAKAEPTLDELKAIIWGLRNMGFPDTEKGWNYAATRKQAIEFIQRLWDLRASPPAAERTALKELREKAERLRSSAPNLSIAGNIVIPRADIEKGKAFVLMNREEYWGRIKSIREKIYGDAQERAGANTP